ncbi:MAG: hypothetical protein WBA93_12590 [Microcoleaceae cyanobacterium]
MKQALQPQQSNQPTNQPTINPQIIKQILSVGTVCLVLGVGGLIAIFSQKPKSEKLVEKIITKPPQTEVQQQTNLPPYTLFVEGDSVVVKFHSTDSNMQFNNVSNKQKTCLANGGGIGCVLPGYVAENPDDNQREAPAKNQPKREASYGDFSFLHDGWLIIGLGGALAGYLISTLRKK